MAEGMLTAEKTGQTQQAAGGEQQSQAGTVEAGQTQTDAREMVSRAEMEKVIGERQAAKERARAAEEVAKKIQADPRLGIQDESWKAFQEWESHRGIAEREKAIKTGDVEAIETRVREPLQKQNVSLQQRNDVLKGQLTGLLKIQALKSAAVAAGAVNPDQVVGLLRDRVRMVEDTATGQFRPEYIDNDGQPMYDGNGNRIIEADIFVRSYLALPDNSNLVRSRAVPGSGAKLAGGSPDSRKPTTVAEFLALPPERRQEIANSMSQDERKAFLGIQSQAEQGYL